MKLNLTPEEKKFLRSKRITIKSLEERSINEISEILDVSKERAHEIVFQSVSDFPSYLPKPITSPLIGKDMLRIADIVNTVSPFHDKSISAILAMNKQLDTTAHMMKSLGPGIFPVLDKIQQSNNMLTASGMAKMLGAIDKITGIEAITSKSFANSLLMSDVYQKLRLPDIASSLAFGAFTSKPDWLKIVTEMNSYGSLAQKSLGAFEWAALGGRLNIAPSAMDEAQKHFLSFSSDYASLLKAIAKEPVWLEPHPILTKMPAIEYFTHANALESISVEDDTDAEEIAPASTELQTETTFSIENYLPRLHAGLPKMWLGAQQALQSSNVDRVRHFNVSVRELFTHLMQMLAPDKAIKAWSTDEKDFHNARPTRKARFTYICRELTGGSYGKFLAKDIATMLELIDLFQGETHGIESDLSDQQLFALKIRVEGALRFLLEIEFNTNRSA